MLASAALQNSNTEDQQADSVAIQAEFDYKTALKTSQEAIGNILGDYAVSEAYDRVRSLAEFRGKPLVLSLVYTSCYEICPMTTRHLAEVVAKARKALGIDSFNIAVIGFDSRMDTPEAMRLFAVKQGIDEDPAWHLLSVKPDIVPALIEDLGFDYYPSSRGFDHIIQVSVIDSNGELYRQVYGQAFSTPLLIEPLKDLVLGKPKPNQSLTDELVNKVRFFCTTYDPVRDGYYFDYSLFVGMLIGALIILSGAAFILKETFRRKLPGKHSSNS
ncbi:MAG: SCO family protein [Proteobacteria bacterium]|nr:SCO family protein [Pseudomonadota bacterium]